MAFPAQGEQGLTVPCELLRARLTARHMPSLDGVRGIAILWVMLFHFFPLGDRESWWANVFFEFTGTGWLGVDLFFVLSGFLITRILVGSRDAPGYFVNFYARRFLRIFPLCYGVLAVVLLVPLLFPSLHTEAYAANIQGNQAWLWLYGMNWHHWLHGEWLFHCEWLELNHFWSLAVEEQFYLVWPLLLWVLPRWAWKPGLLGLIVALYTVRLVNALSGADWPHFRMDGLLVGALLYLLLSDERIRERWLPWVGRFFAAGMVFFVVFTLWRDHGLRPGDRMVSVVGLPVFQWTMACGIAAGLSAQETSLGYRWLNGRVLVALGKYSYGLYVYHVLLRPVINPVAIQETLLPEGLRGTLVGHLSSALLLMAASFIMAWCSYQAYEKHFLKLKGRFAGEMPAAIG